jgi:hypothetical protein
MLLESKQYLHSLSLVIKFSSLRTGNVRPFIGAFSHLNLSSNSKSIDDNEQQRFRIKPWTTNYELGLGMIFSQNILSFTLYPRSFGINDELIRDNDPNSPWTGNIQSLKSRAILINFTFH